jgi:hypothetical protein
MPTKALGDCSATPKGHIKIFDFFDLAFGTTLKGYGAGGHPQLVHGGGDITPMS